MTVEATRPFLLICAPAAHAEHTTVLVMGWPSGLLDMWWIPTFPLQTLVGSYSTASSQKVQVSLERLGYSCMLLVCVRHRYAALLSPPSTPLPRALSNAPTGSSWRAVDEHILLLTTPTRCAHGLRSVWPPPHHAQDEEGLESEVPARGAYTACPPAARPPHRASLLYRA